MAIISCLLINTHTCSATYILHLHLNKCLSVPLIFLSTQRKNFGIQKEHSKLHPFLAYVFIQTVSLTTLGQPLQAILSNKRRDCIFLICIFSCQCQPKKRRVTHYPFMHTNKGRYCCIFIISILLAVFLCALMLSNYFLHHPAEYEASAHANKSAKLPQSGNNKHRAVLTTLSWLTVFNTHLFKKSASRSLPLESGGVTSRKEPR